MFGLIMAWVGQASRQRVQVPQVPVLGSSGVNGMVVRISPRSTNEPNSGVISVVFLPIKPRPALTA